LVGFPHTRKSQTVAIVGDDITEALGELSPVRVASLRTSSIRIVCRSVSHFRAALRGPIFSVLVVGTYAHCNATARFLGEASQKRETASDVYPA
jgi:hypothetical protein